MTQEHLEELVDKSAEIEEILEGIEDFDEFFITIRSVINAWCRKRGMSNLFVISRMYEKERDIWNELRKLRK